jgi:hypothetical protein
VRKAREEPFGAIQQCLDALVVHDLRAVNLGFEHESFRINEQVALSAFHLLAAIVTTLIPSYSGRFD